MRPTTGMWGSYSFLWDICFPSRVLTTAVYVAWYVVHTAVQRFMSFVFSLRMACLSRWMALIWQIYRNVQLSYTFLTISQTLGSWSLQLHIVSNMLRHESHDVVFSLQSTVFRAWFRVRNRSAWCLQCIQDARLQSWHHNGTEVCIHDTIMALPTPMATDIRYLQMLILSHFGWEFNSWVNSCCLLIYYSLLT